MQHSRNFYKIPKSIINPKPVQKPHPKILLGGFSSKTFERMVKYADGYIGVLAGSFEYFTNCITIFNDSITKSSKSRKDFNRTVLTYPYILNRISKSDRVRMTGRTIDEIGLIYLDSKF